MFKNNKVRCHRKDVQYFQVCKMIFKTQMTKKSIISKKIPKIHSIKILFRKLVINMLIMSVNANNSKKIKISNVKVFNVLVFILRKTALSFNVVQIVTDKKR